MQPHRAVSEAVDSSPSAFTSNWPWYGLLKYALVIHTFSDHLVEGHDPRETGEYSSMHWARGMGHTVQSGCTSLSQGFTPAGKWEYPQFQCFLDQTCMSVVCGRFVDAILPLQLQFCALLCYNMSSCDMSYAGVEKTCWLNLESNRPSNALLYFTALWSFVLCCAVSYHAELKCNFLCSAMPHLCCAVLCCSKIYSTWGKPRTVALLQCSALHASVIITIKFFNEPFGAKSQPFESPEKCLTATLNQWTVYSVWAISGKLLKGWIIQNFLGKNITVFNCVTLSAEKSNKQFQLSTGFKRKQVTCANITIILITVCFTSLLQGSQGK